MQRMLYHPTLGATVVDDEQKPYLSSEWRSTPYTDTSMVAPTVIHFEHLPESAFGPKPKAAPIPAEWPGAVFKHLEGPAVEPVVTPFVASPTDRAAEPPKPDSVFTRNAPPVQHGEPFKHLATNPNPEPEPKREPKPEPKPEPDFKRGPGRPKGS